MFDDLLEIKFLGAYRYKAKDSGVFSTPHPYFLYKLTGSVQYFYDEGSFTSAPGDVILFPKGIQFHTNMLIPGEYIVMYFDCEKALGTQIRQFPKRDLRDLSKFFISASDMWAFKDDATYFLCQSRLYEIVGHLAEDVKKSYLPLSERRLLAAPVDYMKENLFLSSFSLSKMYELSGVSETYFRKIFNKMYGMPPKRYILLSRLNRAANLLIADPYLQVQEVAEAVGYTDTFHFSKIFKKEFNVSPKNYYQQYYP